MRVTFIQFRGLFLRCRLLQARVIEEVTSCGTTRFFFSLFLSENRRISGKCYFWAPLR